MKEHIYNNKKQKRFLLVFLFAIIIIIGAVSVFIRVQGNHMLEDDVDNYLEEISLQTSYKINQRILFNQNSLSYIADNLDLISDVEGVIDNVTSDSPFEWIGFIDKNEVLHVKNHDNIDISLLPFINDVRMNKKSVSGKLLKLDDEEGVLYTSPISGHSNYTTIAGYVPVSKMKLLLNTDTFKGIGFSHVIDEDGNYILHSGNKNALLKDDNLFQDMQKNTKIEKGKNIEIVKAEIADGKKGSLKFEIGNETRAITYMPIPDSSWYLISIVPPDIQTAQLKEGINFAILLIAGTTIILSAVYLLITLRISNRKNREISKIAYVDPVTEGSTRAKFMLDSKNIFSLRQPFSFLILDIKGFKLINDSFGSKQGDKVLKHVYDCILKNLHEGEYACRDNDDNFDILIKRADKTEISRFISDVANDINQFNDKKSSPYYINIECGCYVTEEQETSIVKLKDFANTARKNNQEKEKHFLWSNVFYNDVIRVKMRKEKEMKDSMESALNNDEFSVYLQPKVSLENGNVVGAEALVRWVRPNKEMIYPDEFVPLFEKTGFIIKLDLYVFEKVCQTLRKWIDENRYIIPISVNLSRNHLHFKDFLKEYKKIQEQYQIPSEYIELEITETVVFENLQILKGVIDEIHAMGYRCSMDDFGSGYSSLNVLKEIPVDILKIDRIFFNCEQTDRGDKIIQSVIGLAKKLTIDTVAEGVETIPQVEQLKEMACDIVQGYVFDKPMPISDFESKYKDNPKLF
ncbi:MAG: EAL domain-containing protein [Erysipelotrichaceae bacterium]|nr:EAL domain-containing protein [Erysipelotrichaceae bacterium]